MTKLKCFLTTFLLSVIVLCFNACDERLDLSPQTAYSNSNYWKSEAQAIAGLNAAYTRIQGVFARNFIYWGEGRTDNMVLSRESNNTAIGVIRNNMDPSMPEANWGGFYHVIAQTNLILKYLPIMKENGLFASNTKGYNDIRGQAFGLRALCYFYMVRLWGDVPLITEPVESASGDLQLTRTDINTVYEQINNDLDSAFSLLSNTLAYGTPQETRAKITRGAIDAIYTDFYMWRHDYANALLSSERVLKNNNYKLVDLYDANIDYLNNETLIDNSPYARMFTAGFSEESIFEIDYNRIEGSLSNYYGIYGRATTAYFEPSDELMGIFGSNDLRPLQAFYSNGGIYKFFPKVGFDQAARDENIIMYRLADIMLLRAEALIQLDRGNLDEAMTLVNDIRRRAGIGPIDPSEYHSMDNEEIDDIIMKERQKELCFEGKRWFDLVRTGKAISTMEPINGLSNPENILWPISLEVIRVNPKIEQNSFYK